jgi:hypothetical protein
MTTDTNLGKFVPLTQGKYAIVDDEDYDRVMKYKWYAQRRHAGKFCATGRIPGRSSRMLLHRFLLLPPPGMQVDHIDGNPLNNRRSNLRICTNAQNSMNSLKAKKKTSTFKGVFWNRESRKWKSAISPNGRQIHLGFFSDPILAAKAYDKAARLYFSEFAKPNFPDTGA